MARAVECLVSKYLENALDCHRETGFTHLFGDSIADSSAATIVRSLVDQIHGLGHEPEVDVSSICGLIQVPTALPKLCVYVFVCLPILTA